MDSPEQSHCPRADARITRLDSEGEGKEMATDLVFSSVEHSPSPSMYRNQGSFYRREGPKSGSHPELGAIEQVAGPAREYLFPSMGEKVRRKSSLPDSVPVGSYVNRDVRPHHKIRSYSISVTDPVCRSNYESLPQSPAASFLAQFAQPDENLTMPPLDDGCILENKYQIGKVIGRGSFSECREGTPLRRSGEGSPSDKLAMKIVKCEDNTVPNTLNDFDREISVWKRLDHKNILPLLDNLYFDHARIAVTPMAENGTLLEYIRKHGALSEEKAKIIFRQIAEAVCHMHVEHGIAHRDIKLDNILLDAKLHPYLCDFGLSESVKKDSWKARNKSNSDLDERGDRSEGDVFCKGTLWYLPPEELDPCYPLRSSVFGSVGTTSREKGDIWALGVVLYGMVTGKLPFTDDFLPRLQLTLSKGEYDQLPDHLSDGLRAIIRRMLTVEVEERPDIKTLLQDPWLKT